MSAPKGSEADALGCLGGLALLPLGVAYSTALSGYLIMVAWAWFIVPTFHVEPLSLGMACGLDIVWSAFRGTPPEIDETEKDKARVSWVKVCVPLVRQTFFVGIMLGIGYVLHRWFV